jgi:hypothetical protein
MYSTITRAAAAQQSQLRQLKKPAQSPRKSLSRTQQLSGAQVAMMQKKMAKGAKRFDEPDEAAEFHRLKRAPRGVGPIPVERYLKAQAHLREMKQHSFAWNTFLPSEKELGEREQRSLATGAWTALGPGNIGGRTRAMVINSINPNTMYAAGVAGGVWKTTNGGASWSPLLDLVSNLAVNSLAISPHNPEALYAGTGEGYFNGDGLQGAGIFYTTNGGASWLHLASTLTPDFHYVNDIVISPNNALRIYAATETGVWRSLDGGASWTNVLLSMKAAAVLI